ncbi:MAG TPA: hypothetical protein VFK47_15520 [Ktedonobacteraceae bacterium]|nr:hypothetical protein [Ktedonobacteraceae bacterium]
MKDWRGTEIEVGSKVIAHAMGKQPQRAVGRVIKIHDSGLLTLEASDKLKNYSWSRDKIVIGSSSVTVLTKDMFE